MRIKHLYILLFSLCCSVALYGQDKATKVPQSKSKSAVKKLTESLETNESDNEVATNYMSLGMEFYAQGDYVKAENYLQQAVQRYGKTKEKEQQANAYRELAKAQEMQSKFDPAIQNYTNAAKTSTDKTFKTLNTNDAKRLKERDATPQSQSTYVQRNIDLSNLTKNRKEATAAYQQMADLKIEMEDTEGAVSDLESALESATNDPEETTKIKEKIAQTYIADEKYDEAIEINETLVSEAQKAQNPQSEIKQLKNLAQTYIVAKDKEKGVHALQEAYHLAIRYNQTVEAGHTLNELADYYRENNDMASALHLYSDFVQRLDTLIKSDSTLIDEKFFQLHEERIQRLENEQALKDELIVSTNRFNYILLGCIVLILVFLGFIANALYSIRKKNKRIALQSLRREMNPHFIFNSLNSVNQFIAQNNELEANKYLSSYSRLMRNIMENSNKDFITLSTEIEQLKEYLGLEHMRFRDKFTYKIEVDDALDTDAVYIPNMVVQPQLENAVWHGLRYIDNNGLLTLRIEKQEQRVCITVEDNGIGLKRSRELKTKHQKQHTSRGLNNTSERIRLLNELYHITITLNVGEKEGDNGPGVIATITFPLINKKP